MICPTPTKTIGTMECNWRLNEQTLCMSISSELDPHDPQYSSSCNVTNDDMSHIKTHLVVNSLPRSDERSPKKKLDSYLFSRVTNDDMSPMKTLIHAACTAVSSSSIILCFLYVLFIIWIQHNPDSLGGGCSS
jgi:hypothetical protein